MQDIEKKKEQCQLVLIFNDGKLTKILKKRVIMSAPPEGQ